VNARERSRVGEVSTKWAGATFAAGAAAAVLREILRSPAARRREVIMSTVETTTEIKPFHVEVPEEQLGELRCRIEATRLPSRSSSKIGRKACN
jgi:hypothetical protein